MHMPEIYVHSAVAYRDLFVLTLGRRVVVWTGNRSQKKRSQEREGHGRRTEVAMRAEAAMDKASPPTLSHCFSLPPTGITVPAPGSNLPLPVPTLISTQPLEVSLLQTPAAPTSLVPQAEPQETKGSSWQEGLQRASFYEQSLPLQARGPTQPPLPRTFSSQPLPSNVRL